MATSQQFLVCDNSTLANFKQWAQAISTQFGTFGWVQSLDTGQVNWSTIASVPGAAAYVYEIWQPNDGLTNFYAKVEYGNFSGTNSPNVRITLSTATNGAGTPTGLVTATQYMHFSAITPPSTSATYECDFSGAAGRMSVLMWRNGTNNVPGVFAIERSVNASGAYTSSHVTVIVGGVPNGTNTAFAGWSQQTLVFGVGAANTTARNAAIAGTSLCIRSAAFAGVGYGVTTSFNGSIPFDTVAPNIGYFDYPLTVVGAANYPDLVEGIPFSVTLYGSTRTYIPTKNGLLSDIFGYPGGGGNNSMVACVRYD